MSQTYKNFVVIPVVKNPRGVDLELPEQGVIALDRTPRSVANRLRKRFSTYKAVHVYRLTKPERVPFGLEDEEDSPFPPIDPYFT